MKNLALPGRVAPDRSPGGIGDSTQFPVSGGIIGQDGDPIVILAKCPGKADCGPGTPHPARIDAPRHESNGFFGARSVRRTGTAPNPRSRRMPLIR